MAFSRLPDGCTKIEFVANQSFPLPRVLVLLRITRWVWLRTFLTKLAYQRFWRATQKNLLARYQGRKVWVGRPAPTSAEIGEAHQRGRPRRDLLVQARPRRVDEEKSLE
jgi:hypothetical protein